MSKIVRAIVSVSNKEGLAELATVLKRHGVEILSTGGTARALKAAGAETVAIADYTGAPEILDGRVKTLHPKIHGGLLGRPIESHEKQMQEHGIEPIDLVVVNLYPFRETIAAGAKLTDAIEQIDIGGPSMLRSAAKNHERVAVVVDPADYPSICKELDESDGELSQKTRFRLAKKVFAHTADYDGAIAAHLSSFSDDGDKDSMQPFPGTLTLQWEKAQSLRYGENPHQAAAYYRDVSLPAGTLADAEILQGKALSYNNLLDLDAAFACVREFTMPAAVVIKHTNPCGVGTDDTDLAAAYRKARATDPVSAFGSIVALNREVSEQVASELAETFLECVIAPSFAAAARDVLGKKKNLRLIVLDPREAAHESWTMRTVSGGVLVQSADDKLIAAKDANVVSERAPTADELKALDFAWRVAKHVKSNAIVFATADQTVGVGAGQMSRVDAAELAVKKAKLPIKGTVVASDAFFPFRDGLDALAHAGATAVIQPGGSKRDKEVIAAANEHGMAMVFTGMRHFRH